MESHIVADKIFFSPKGSVVRYLRGAAKPGHFGRCVEGPYGSSSGKVVLELCERRDTRFTRSREIGKRRSRAGPCCAAPLPQVVGRAGVGSGTKNVSMSRGPPRRARSWS